MRILFFIGVGGLSYPLAGNEALTLLDREAGSSPNVFEEAARLPGSGGAAVTEKKKYSPPDPKFPTRWRNELEPRFPTEVPGGTQVAPRGLFEYQYNDRSFARGAKLSRARLGVAIQTYYGIEILADALLSSRGDYQGWETLRASIPLNDETRVSAGKFPPPFSTEYSRDAAVRWFPALSPLAAQTAPAASLGVMVEGRGNSMDWKFGWFSGDSDRSIPSINGDGYLLAGIAGEINKGGSESAPDPSYLRWHLDYIYNMGGSRSESIPQGYRHLVSVGAQYSSGPFDFYTDLMMAGGSQNSVYGVTVAGRYWLLQDAVSFVGRYQYASSREAGGLVSYWGIPDTGSDAIFPTDFPASSIAGQVSSFYAGLNIHLDDDNLIIGTGLEYRSLSDVVGDDDFSSWGWSTFARYAF